VLAVFGLCGFLIYGLLPESSTDARPPDGPVYPPEKPSSQRIKELFAKHALDSAEPTVVTSPFRHGDPNTFKIAVVGMPRIGKGTLTSKLAASLGGSDGIAAQITELPDLAADISKNREQIELAAGFDVLIFATDQDLRNYEMAVVAGVVELGTPVIVAATKVDLLSSRQCGELEAALNSRLSTLKTPVAVVLTSADPLPILTQTTTASGEVVEAERAQPVQISSLVAAVKKVRTRGA
jgi:predicted GTPase